MNPTRHRHPARRVLTTLSALSALLALLAFGAAPLSADEPNGPAPLQKRTLASPSAPAPGVARAIRAELDLSALGGSGRRAGLAAAGPEQIGLELPDGSALLLERTERRPLAKGGYAWIGRMVGESRGSAVFVVRNGAVYGSLRRPGLNVQIRPAGDGTHALEERDESWWPELDEDTVGVWEPIPAAADQEPSAVPPSSPIVDVLVVYTAAARAAAGGVEALEALVDLAEIETNSAYEASGVGQRIRVVRVEQTPYIETNNSYSDLTRLQSSTDGYLDEVHGLRDAYGADLVSLWTATGGCGLGYFMSTVSSGFAPWAFSVCNLACATGNLTFAHELGHNMSLRHDWFVDDATSPWGFNHGHVDLDTTLAGSFRSVMAYGSRCNAAFGSSCTRLPYFSNPGVSVDGDPSGVESGTALDCLAGIEPVADCDADNARALDNAAATVESFRPTAVLARITKDVDLQFAEVGDLITYSLTVTNDSSSTAENVVVTDTVPAHTVLDVSSLSLDAVADGTAAGSLVTWNTGKKLLPGQSLVRTFSVTAVEGGIADNTAQVASTSTPLIVPSNTVSTAIWASVGCGFTDGFESGSLSHLWKVETTFEGRVRVLADAPATGAYSAVLDDSVPGGATSTAALVLAADLEGVTEAELAFSWAEAGDENDSEDGVFIRAMAGDPWVKVESFIDRPALSYQQTVIDLDAAAAANGLLLGNGFQIRFQFRDNWSFVPANPAAGDGYLIDDVALSCTCVDELGSASISGPASESSSCLIRTGPNFVVEADGELTLSSPQGVALDNGFCVHEGGQLTIVN